MAAENPKRSKHTSDLWATDLWATDLWAADLWAADTARIMLFQNMRSQN
jgi:hypothetical protein